MKDTILNEHERHSVAWQKIDEYLQTRLELLRKRNENDIPPEATAKLRGRLAECRLLLTRVEGTHGPTAEEADDVIQ